MTNGEEPLAVRYEYDPSTGAVDPTGYWALTEMNTPSCAVTTPEVTPTAGINPLLLLLIPLGLVGVVAVTEEKKGGR